MSCHLISVCGQIRSLLERIGAAHAEIDVSCYPPAPCDGVFANLELLASRIEPENARIVLDFFRGAIGDLPVLKSPAARRAAKKPPFYCPEIEISIYQPCRVSSCAFHTGLDRDDPQEWIRNCILNYRVTQQSDSLEIRELSFLDGKTSNQLRSSINAGLAQLRQAALLVKTEKEGAEIVETPEDACSVCWGSLDTEGPYRVSSGFIYCSEECYDRKRPETLDVEQRFGLAASRVLDIGATSFASVRNMAHALGVTSVQLRELCEQHDIDISHLQ